MMEQFKYDRGNFLRTAAIALASAGLATIGFTTAKSGKIRRGGRLPVKGELFSLDSATGWLNSKPLTADDLVGKIVLIGFWNYTCINWLRSLPYVRAWAAKYKDYGLVVIGVHAPEFVFERNIDNVRRAVEDLKVNYPVAIDNDQEIWNAFKNEYWPALYFVDARGRVRDHQFGEGEYQESEKTIQQLLNDAGVTGFDRELVSVDAHGIEVAADWSNLKSPETYLGYWRTENFASSGGIVKDKNQRYTTPARLKLNQWGLYGDWTMGKESTLLNAVNGRLAHCFHARDLHLVMGPATKGASVRFRVFLDGKPPGDAHGADIDSEGNGIVTEQRLYQLIRQPKPLDDRRIEVKYFDQGVEAYSFTFG